MLVLFMGLLLQRRMLLLMLTLLFMLMMLMLMVMLVLMLWLQSLLAELLEASEMLSQLSNLAFETIVLRLQLSARAVLRPS